MILEMDFIEVQERQSNYYYENYINNNSPLLQKEGRVLLPFISP
jgi:hypothetical protein